jgi:hypothetical protein
MLPAEEGEMRRIATTCLLLSTMFPPMSEAQTFTTPEVFVSQSPSIPNATSSQEDPRIALSNQGVVLVAWERTVSVVLGSGPDHGIYSRTFDATGSSPGEVTAADSLFNETDPSLAGNGSGKAVLVYNVDDLSNIPACPAEPFGKVQERVFLDGVPSGGDQVNTNGGGGRRGVAGISPSGTYVVAYEGNECPGLNIQRGTKLRRFDPTRRINLDGLISELPLAVAVNSFGSTAVVVADGSSGFCDTASPCPLRIHRFTADGTALPALSFDVYANTGLVTTSDPVIALRDDGSIIVVWVRKDFETPQTTFVLARIYDSSGVPLTPEMEVSEGVVPDGAQSFVSPSLAVNEDGDFVVGFAVLGQPYIRAYSSSGAPRSAPVEVTDREVSALSVALADDGSGAVAFLSGEEDEIHYRRFTTELVSGSCSPSPTVLCLNNNRFRVTAAWRTSGGTSGNGQAVPLTSDTGYFWFFGAENVEVILKVLNGCPVNQRYWVFASGLTDVNVEMTVIDTRTGSRRVYRNPQGTAFQPIQDTNAFATCP